MRARTGVAWKGLVIPIARKRVSGGSPVDTGAASKGLVKVELHDAPAPEFMLGFLALFDTEVGHGRCGAAMVTNERGVPLEFRVSEPVRPSPLRRAIYGESLWPYVEVELIARRLLSELRRLPALVLTNRTSVLDVTSYTTLCFVADADAIVQPSDAVGRYRRLEATGATHTALALVAATEAALTPCAEQVASSMRRFDPVEVFARIEKAYGELAATDGRYRYRRRSARLALDAALGRSPARAPRGDR